MWLTVKPYKNGNRQKDSILIRIMQTGLGHRDLPGERVIIYWHQNGYSTTTLSELQLTMLRAQTFSAFCLIWLKWSSGARWIRDSQIRLL